MVADVVAWRRGSGESHWFPAGGPPHTTHRSSVSSESRCSSLLWSMSSMARTTSAALYTGRGHLVPFSTETLVRGDPSAVTDTIGAALARGDVYGEARAGAHRMTGAVAAGGLRAMRAAVV